MAFEDYQSKPSVVIVYTGEGKGKTSASIGLMCRALGTDWKVAVIQFIKSWTVGEHTFIQKITPLYQDQIYFFKGGKGFYNAGDISAKDVTEKEHQNAAKECYEEAYSKAASGDYELVICDEINNAYNDGLLTIEQLKNLITNKHPKTSLCLSGRNFPEELINIVDIATNMTKIKHHFDDKFIANKGIDY